MQGGSPALDIGGDIGALVLLVDRSLAGTELFVADGGGRTVHTGVWLRRLGAGLGEVAAAVFCELPAGRWTLLGPGDRAGQLVVITGGEVTELDCRPAPSPASAPAPARTG